MHFCQIENWKERKKKNEEEKTGANKREDKCQIVQEGKGKSETQWRKAKSGGNEIKNKGEMHICQIVQGGSATHFEFRFNLRSRNGSGGSIGGLK